MKNTQITNYDDSNIMEVLQRIYRETEEHRTRCLEMYDLMAEKMKTDDGNLVVLAQLADKWVSEANKTTDQLVKMSAVMQKLKYARDHRPEGVIDTNELFKRALEDFDIKSVTPFIRDKNGQLIQQKEEVIDVSISRNEQKIDNKSDHLQDGINPISSKR